MEFTKEEIKTIKKLYDHLMECPLCRGEYDAVNSDEKFMYGVATVMELVARTISDDLAEEHSDLFIENMLISEGKNI
jgi:predicted anti-sigma-YlaC factor YlaD